MRLPGVFCLVLFSICSPSSFDGTRWDNPGKPTTAVTHANFHSDAMNVDIGYNVLLPPGYATNENRRYPVVYFLHGRNGDENAEVPHLQRYLATATPPQAIVVFPNGGKNSKYIDAAPGSPMYGVVMVETAIARELVDHVDAHYRTIADRSGRFIQGFSMGGMGALRIGLSHSERFGAIYAFSPALDDTAENIADEEPDLLAKMLNGDPQQWKARMASTLAVTNAENVKGKLRIEIRIGEADELLPSVRDFAETLSRAGVQHTLTEVPGLGHTYDFGPNFEQLSPP